MNSQRIPHTALEASQLVYGCAGLGGKWDGSPLAAETAGDALRVIRAALDCGFTFFDHADIYCLGKSEEAFGAILRDQPSLRDRIVLQSKCGVRFAGDPVPGAPGRYDFSRSHIVHSVEGSLGRLKTDRLDILLLHRPDALVEPDEVAEAFDDLHASGKVRHFGVSNHSLHQVELLRKFLRQPIVVHQIEFSLLHTLLLDTGVSVNQDKPRFSRPGEGLLDYCRLHEISVQAWTPLAKGRLSGRPLEPGEEPRVARAAALVGELAREKGVSREAIVLAWILRHPARIQPVVGTMDEARIRACAGACDVSLTREEWYALFVAARGEPMA
ncbi:MAG: aldo/keto reductase [Terrimicrobiaceae bacterium]